MNRQVGRASFGSKPRGRWPYVLVGDALGTIIFTIEEAEPFSLHEEFGVSMRATDEQCGGHAPWVRPEEAARQFLDANPIRGFALNSSIGFDGAVWARSYTARGLVAP